MNLVVDKKNTDEESDSSSESKKSEESSIMYSNNSNKLPYHKFLKDGEHTFMFTYYREKNKKQWYRCSDRNCSGSAYVNKNGCLSKSNPHSI